MPLENKLSNSYDPSQGVAGGIGSIAATMRAVPAIRAQAAMRQAQMGHYQALTGEANAHADLYNKMGLKTQQEIDSANRIKDAILKSPPQTNPDGSITLGASLVQSLSSEIPFMAKGAGDFGSGIQRLFQTQNAPIEAGANRQNKLDIATQGNKTREDIANNKPIVAPAGSSIYMRGQAPVDNNPGPADVDNPDVREGASNPIAARLIATAPGKPPAMQPYNQETRRQVLNPNFNPKDTNSPQYLNLTNTTKRVVGGGQPPIASPAPAAANQMVRVKHPNGQTGTIPASQLDDALKLGYTQIQ